MTKKSDVGRWKVDGGNCKTEEIAFLEFDPDQFLINGNRATKPNYHDKLSLKETSFFRLLTSDKINISTILTI